MCTCHGGCSSAKTIETEKANRHHDCRHEEDGKGWVQFFAPACSLILLIAGVMLSHLHAQFFVEHPYIELLWYIVAFLPVGLPVFKEALEGISEKDFFNEFTLMAIACMGAFYIGEYPEAVGVMLFYTIGETLQDRAVDRARRDIARLIDFRGEKARLVRGNDVSDSDPKAVAIGETIEVRPGERVPLDGVLLNQEASFDSSALTGESLPMEIDKGGEVLAGMIALSSTVRIRVEKPYGQSALSRILEMVEDAAGRKAQTELFIRRFAAIYTPVVIILATLIVLIPGMISLVSASFTFVFSEWLYRALVFLVISCPCALVVSVPLGYFAGIGAASKAGILIKGGNYLEALRKIDTVAFDKTGTLTTGKFHVEKTVAMAGSEERLLYFMASAELHSSHPLGKAIVETAKKLDVSIPSPTHIQEKAGYGIKAVIDGHHVLVGNLRFLEKEGISFHVCKDEISGSVIACAIDGIFEGYVVLDDSLKSDAGISVSSLKAAGIQNVVMLSGDRQESVNKYSGLLGIAEAYGDMLPQDKAVYVNRIAETPGRQIAFVGDGMNDAPVLALSDVGFAMGGLGSDAAVQRADVVIQSDMPSRVATAIRIGKYTHSIVLENIAGAIGIKIAVLILGAFGIASLWGAVLADVGVALAAVLNSMRILWKRYE